MIAAIAAVAAMIAALVEAAIAIAVVLGIVEVIFDPKGSQKVGNLVGNLVTGLFKIIDPVIADVEGALAPVAKSMLDSVNNNGGAIMAVFRDPAAAVAKSAFTDAEANLTAAGESTVANSVDQAAAALGNAFGFGLASHGVSAAFEALFPKALNSFNAFGPMLEKLAGFEEVAAAVREPLYEAAFLSLSLDLQARTAQGI